MRVLTSRLRKVERLAFGPDGRHLFASGMTYGNMPGLPPDLGLDVWDLGGGPDPADRHLDEFGVRGFALAADGRWLYAEAGLPPIPPLGYVAVDRATRAVARLGFHGGLGVLLAVGPDGRFAAFGHTTSRPDWGLRCWHPSADGPPVLAWEVSYRRTDIALGLAFHPAGRYLLSVDRVRVGRGETRAELTRRDPDTGAAVGPAVRCPNLTVHAVAFSPDGSRFAATSGLSLFVFDPENPMARPVKATNDNRKHFTAVAYHPSGRSIATTGNDATVKFWDPATLTVARTFTWKVGKMRSLAFNPDGTLAAAGSDTGKVVIWDVDG